VLSWASPVKFAILEKNNPSIRDDQVLAEKAKKAQAEAEGAVFKFQRSTSVHFRVEP
jgi:hypothetical protein